MSSQRLENSVMVEAAGIEPASANDPPSVLHAYPNLLILTRGYPTGRAAASEPVGFSSATPGSRHRDLVIVLHPNPDTHEQVPGRMPALSG